MRLSKMMAGLICYLFLVSAAEAARHDIHISYAQFELGGTTLSGKITYYRDDFYKALIGWNGRDVQNLDRTLLNPVILNFLDKHFSITINGTQRLPFGVVVRKEDNTTITIEFSYIVPANIQSLLIEHRVLFREYNDQMNLMLVKAFGSEHNYIFTPSQPIVTITP